MEEKTIRWVYVGDNLPPIGEVGKEYLSEPLLVCTFLQQILVARLRYRKNIYKWIDKGNNYDINDITHWALLPELPEPRFYVPKTNELPREE